MVTPKQKRRPRKRNNLAELKEVFQTGSDILGIVTGHNMPAWLGALGLDKMLGPLPKSTGAPLEGTIVSDPYFVLGLPKTATKDEVKQRYRQLARVFHPDNKGGYDEAMKRLNAAYKAIVDGPG
jgi:DnaJ-domain-containing protein 1